MNIIVAYAPTLIKSEEEPKIREDFYEMLSKTIKTHKLDSDRLL